MPVPNDLTPEEEAEFGQHGVPPAGPGREPLSETPPQQQQQQEPANDDQGQQGRQTFHRQDGRFASREEAEAGQAKPSQRPQPGQEPGQQQQQPGQEPGQQPGEEGQPDSRTVPLAALHQERLQRQALARRAQLAETRLNAILSREEPQAPPQMPDINQDPAGYVIALEERLQAFERERVETQQNQQVDSSISSDEDMFTQTRPDYPQASDYFVQSRAQELLAFYPPDQAQKMMLAEARQIAQAAWQRGQSVGEVIYGLAQARGYNPGMPQREPPQQQQQQGGQPQRRGPAPGDVIDSINQGQAASRSLSGGGGASAESLNANAILDMSDEEFAGWLGEGSAATRKFANLG